MAQPIQGHNPWLLLAAGAQVQFGVQGENCELTNNMQVAVEYRIEALVGRINLVVNAVVAELTVPIRTEDAAFHQFIFQPRLAALVFDILYA